MNVTVPNHFWEPLRQRLVLNTIAYLPVLNTAGAVLSSPQSILPIVTYISRQGGGRRLTQESHDGLVKSLNEMADEGVFELHIVRMETMTFSQQVEAVARSTVSFSVGFIFLLVYTRSKIILGVHGNGLTVSPNPFFKFFIPYVGMQHQLWMPPSPHSTIIEMFFPSGKYCSIRCEITHQ